MTASVVRRFLSTRFLKFAIVGVSGIGVNMAILYLLTEFAHVPYYLSSLVAIECSILSNFTLNDLWTWRGPGKKIYARRFVQYHLSVGIVAIVCNWLLLVFLTSAVGLNYMVSNLLGIAAGFLFNFVLNDIWTFRDRRGTGRTETT